LTTPTEKDQKPDRQKTEKKTTGLQTAHGELSTHKTMRTGPRHAIHDGLKVKKSEVGEGGHPKGRGVKKVKR